MSRQPGFSLVELVVATAVLLITVAATSSLTVEAQRGASRADASGAAYETVHAWIAHMRCLPFAPVSCGAGTPPAEASLVGALFPHADPASNTAAASYQETDSPACAAGGFITRTRLEGGDLQATSRFVVGVAGLWQPLAVADLAGWRAGEMPPPSAALSVDVEFRSAAGQYVREGAVFTLPLVDDRVTTP